MREISLQLQASLPLGCGQQERPRKMENQKLVYPSRQCSSTPVCLGQGFISKEQCDETESSL
jgi:hypothetical protein